MEGTFWRSVAIGIGVGLGVVAGHALAGVAGQMLGNIKLKTGPSVS